VEIRREETCLWRRVLVARHGVVDGGWCTNLVHGSHGYGLQKSIIMGYDSFAQHLEFKVGTGNRIRLWHDRLCGELPLKEAFPVLFECASNREATIETVLIRQNEEVEWNVSFIRNFTDWEIDGVLSFVSYLFPYTCNGR
jgi:hypothetical protein